MRELSKRVLPGNILFLLRTMREVYWDYKRFIDINNKYLFNYESFSCTKRYLRPARRTILFYPDIPGEGNVTYKMCALLGYRITRLKSREYDIAFKRRDTTYFDKSILTDQESESFINGNSVDISKDHVASVFEDTFGYTLSVNPCEWTGKAVEKSNKNATHDGKIIECPIPSHEVNPRKSYQKLIDNRASRGEVVDMRVPIHGDNIPLVYLKYRHQNSRFSNDNDSVRIADPNVLFSDNEISRILSFASRMGIDYGELDILRDNQDDRIYIVDANNTPAGPPNGLNTIRKWVSLQLMIPSFVSLVERY